MANQLNLTFDFTQVRYSVIERNLMNYAFCNGSTAPNKADEDVTTAIARLVTSGLMELTDRAEFKLTLAGVETFTKQYLASRQSIDSVNMIDYYRINFTRMKNGEVHGSPIAASGNAAFQQAKTWVETERFSLHEDSSNLGYVVINFVDPYTGELHALFPGDTIIIDTNRIIYHKFTE